MARILLDYTLRFSFVDVDYGFIKGTWLNHYKNKLQYRYGFLRYMKYKVDNVFVNMTYDCIKGFSCLSGRNECLCEIADYVNDELLFIKQDSDCVCHYKRSFSDSFICACPTRREIYKCYTV